MVKQNGKHKKGKGKWQKWMVSIKRSRKMVKVNGKHKKGKGKWQK